MANITCLLGETCRDGQCYRACSATTACPGAASCVDGACRTSCDGGLCVGKVLARCEQLTGAPDARPYFLWDEPTTTGAFRAALARALAPEKAVLLGKLMREARDTDVWEFTTVREVRARRRAFWRYLLDAWAAHGIA